MYQIQKLAVIGGGSTYTPELLEGFINHRDQVQVDTISLHDIDAERLEIVGGLAQRMYRRAGLSTRIELEGDRKAAIEGADFILSQIRVGWMPSRILDEKIPLRYGILGQETVGAGGLANALRTVPVSLRIAEDVARLAPKAWFLNFTNPSSIITQALIQHSGLQRVVGLCNVPINSQRCIANILGVEETDLWLDWLGLNHLGWIRAIYVGGQNRFAEVLERMQKQPTEEARERFPFDASLFASLNLIPTYYLRYYYHTARVLKEVEQAGRTRGEVVAEIEAALLQQFKDPRLEIKPPELSQRGGALYSEAAFRLIFSLLADRRDVQILIVRNQGAIKGLPEDVSVEVPALVGAHGVTPLTMEPPPAQIDYLLQSVKSSETMAIEAAISGSRSMAVQAMLANPLLPNFETAERVTDELLNAHREYLPAFFRKG